MSLTVEDIGGRVAPDVVAGNPHAVLCFFRTRVYVRASLGHRNEVPAYIFYDTRC